ncbi:MAG TPA: response regulator transcription factor [Thermoanaerobaculia bacterium]|nr:response regulator transcription factor [Thermoanaerobaculia bacterium]
MATVRPSRPRIVLADDHPHVLSAFGRLLGFSCEVVGSVSSGRDAIEAVMTLRPDVLVADLMMPDLNGLEVCRRVKHAAPETAVVIVTAFGDTEIEKVALEAGASALIPKHSAADALEDMLLQIFAEKQD